MSNNSKIISISGNPVSGKSTVVNKIIERLKEKGFSDENIHLISTGTIFREYFNKLMSLISNIDNKEKMIENSKDTDIKRILRNPIYRGKVRDLCISLKQSGINPKEFDIANANTSQELGSIRHIIDEIVDSEMADLGKQIVEKNNPDEVWLIDSRLAFHNIPESFAVRLTVRDKVAAERLFNDTSRGKEDSNYKSLEEAEKKVIERKHGEQERYKRRYGIDLEDQDNYNLIIDTSYADIDEIADTILKCAELDRDGKEYAKKWASPKLFLPLQRIQSTYEQGYGSKMNIKQMKESIIKNGFDPGKPFYIINVDGILYIIEGHHRNFAMAYLGNTLIPYTECPYLNQEEERDRASCLRLSDIYDHEEFFYIKTPNGLVKENYRYTKPYPDIYKLAKSHDESSR